jgi:A/G-specific adenine glycosylase
MIFCFAIWIGSVERWALKVSPEFAGSFRSALLHWYRRCGRDLPWRRTRDPYAVLVSEIMLQQTQVATVIPYYYRWLRRFPDFASLARASEQDVLQLWQGLGYYRRARNLHATARAIVKRQQGRFPAELATARDLPGIGRYTANAVATFALGRAVPLAEANISRTLARLFNVTTRIDSSAGQKQIWQLAATLLPYRRADRFNSALMDLGALVCVNGKPRCGVCPVKKFCRAERPESLPVRRTRAPVRRLTEPHLFAVKQNKLLLDQSSDRWRGMWILPRLDAPPPAGQPVYRSVFSFTNHRIRLLVFRRPHGGKPPRSRRWFRIDSLESIPMPSPHRRAIVDLLRRFHEPGERRSPMPGVEPPTFPATD